VSGGDPTTGAAPDRPVVVLFGVPPLVALLAMLVVIDVEQFTLPPPPLAEPLHWFTVTGNVELTAPDALQ